MATHAPLPTLPPQYKDHIDRTAASPRQADVHRVTLSAIVPVNPSIRLLQLSIADRARGVPVSCPSAAPRKASVG